MTASNNEFKLVRPEGMSAEDFLKAQQCAKIMVETMATMSRNDLSGSCGVRICRSRRNRTFGAPRQILERDF